MWADQADSGYSPYRSGCVFISGTTGSYWVRLYRAAYDTVCYVFKLEIDADCGVPAMIGAVQTFGDLVHWHLRKFEVYDPLYFLAEVTHHIPNRSEHHIWYYGWY